MAAGGIGGLLITSEMVGPDKIKRLVQLTLRQPDTMSVVDHAGHADQLNAAAAAAKTRLNVMIDIDPGSRRTGIAAGAPARDLARHVVRLPHLQLRGIHCYSGSSAHVVGFEARREHSAKAMAPAIATFTELRQEGLPLEILSGGSTGTYNIDPAFKAMTELQVGSYVFMDVDYRRIGGQSGALYDDFGAALSVIATVISKQERNRATVDAGFKAFATDKKFGPELKDPAGAAFSWGGDEHGILDLQQAARDVQLGERLEFIVPHCDPNVNLYDRLHCVRGEKVEAVWPVARGHG
jgi:D-serine deaminase-like pyridoxal phosphate-dependent protein